ncbi:aspartyl protease AED3-like [Cynara cardunculus var. scolymus]|uniref:Aspartic peptidase n=1 Tax=Cynara cardunculus var. scolymus TaxID=59895 RepID=A0A118K037_CYNCS|nr:aspartyl protease AED3-like [Cynara cardunculus var. scolymus]KVI00842.1 Aspartic peptidase [Cynara cardunculus var. scolymus]
MESLPLLLVFLLFFVSGHSLNPTCNSHDQHSTLKVYHVSSPCSPFRPKTALSWPDTILQMQADDQTRLAYLSSLVAGRSIVPIGSGRQIIQSPTYIVKAKIGTPAQTLLMALDTSTDMAMVPCTGCVGCASAGFAFAKSTTFTSLNCGAAQCRQVMDSNCLGTSTCSMNMTYGSSSIAANLAQDNLTLAMDTIVGYPFGCIQKVTGTSLPPQGVLGLGRGSLSLLSQSKSLYKSTFSYCLPSFKSPKFAGTLRLGPDGQPKNIKFTPLLTNPRRPSLYYVKLVGIKVGPKLVNIPPTAFALNPNNGAGTIIDSGTVFTRLVTPAYTAVRDEFRRRMGRKTVVTSLGGFDTCYKVPVGKQVPTMSFVLEGVVMAIKQENFLIYSSNGGITCLAMSASPSLNVIANMQQQNHRILFDLPNSRIGISPERCS